MRRLVDGFCLWFDFTSWRRQGFNNRFSARLRQGYSDREAGAHAGFTGYIDAASQFLNVLSRLVGTNAHAGEPFGAFEGFEEPGVNKLFRHARSCVLNKQHHFAFGCFQVEGQFAVRWGGILSILYQVSEYASELFLLRAYEDRWWIAQ